METGKNIFTIRTLKKFKVIIFAEYGVLNTTPVKFCILLLKLIGIDLQNSKWLPTISVCVGFLLLNFSLLLGCLELYYNFNVELFIQITYENLIPNIWVRPKIYS